MASITRGHLYVYTLGQGSGGGIAMYPIAHGRFAHTPDGYVGAPPSGTYLLGRSAFDASGNLYTVACVVTNGCGVSPELVVYPPPYTGATVTVPLPSSTFGMNDLQGIAVDSRGYVFVQMYPTGQTVASTVYVYQPLVQGATLVQTIPIGTISNASQGGLAIGLNDELFVADDAHNRIDVYTTPVTHPVLARTIAVQQPSAIAIDRGLNAELYVGTVTAGKPIVKVFPYDAHGKLAPLRTIGSHAFCSNSPIGPDVAVNGAQLYVTATTCTPPGSGGSVVAEFNATSHGLDLPPVDSISMISCCNFYEYAVVGP